MKNNIASKATILVLALIMVLSCISCDTPEPLAPSFDESESKTSGDSRSETPDETVGESGGTSETDPPQDEKPYWEQNEGLMISDNGNTGFKIIRPQVTHAGEENIAKSLRDFLREKDGNKITIGDDWINDKHGFTEGEYEILVGKTNRKESEEVYASLREDDYAVAIVGTKIVIAGADNSSLAKALVCFTESVHVEDGKVFLAKKDTRYLKKTYEVESITINGRDISEFRFVYGKDAEENIKLTVDELKVEFMRTFGYVLKTVNDDVPAGESEIIFGSTSREGSRQKCEALRTKDYEITAIGNLIYLSMGSEVPDYNEIVYDLLKIFGNNYQDGKIELTTEDFYAVYNADYKYDTFLLNRTDIKDYTIVYPDGDDRLLTVSMKLKSYIESLYGRTIEIKPESEQTTGPRILVGTGDGGTDGFKNGEYIIKKLDGSLVVGGKRGDKVAAGAAVNKLLTLFAKSDVPSVEINMESSETALTSQYKVMTYNEGDNSTTNVGQVAAIIKDYAPDILGLQETQFIHIAEYERLVPGYKDVFYATEPVYSIGPPILYREDKFEVLETGTQWLSDTPDVPYSMYKESDYTRNYVYAIMRDKETGAEFVVVNTHIDYVDTANTKQIKVLLDLTARFSYMPIIYTADWNTYTTEPGYQLMVKAGYESSYDGVEDAKKPGTMVGSNGTIDFIFYDKAYSEADGYKVVNDHKYSNSASDHYAVVSNITVYSAENK